MYVGVVLVLFGWMVVDNFGLGFGVGMLCGRDIKGGGWCCLSEEVGVLVVVVVGDFFWMSPLLFGSSFDVACSCLSFRVLKCLGCFEGACPSS